MNPDKLALLKLLIRGSGVIGRAQLRCNRTALEYSNVIGCERLPQTATDPMTCPNDRELTALARSPRGY
jgi:hypothetical protein